MGAATPEFLDLKNMTHIEVESRTFPSEDTPDIVLLCAEGVGVLKVETNHPTRGASQALKRRTLSCAQRELDVQSPPVKAFLVAWAIPEHAKQLCARYGIWTRVKGP